jgi:hypothetical protein
VRPGGATGTTGHGEGPAPRRGTRGTLPVRPTRAHPSPSQTRLVRVSPCAARSSAAGRAAVTELPTIGESTSFSRSREMGRIALEIVVWVLAFSLLLCVPSDRTPGSRSVERARPAETR